MFWRRGFWNRAVSWVVLALVVMAVPVPLVKSGYEDLRNQRLVSQRTLCVQASAPCIEQKQVSLEGPDRSRRDFRPEWDVHDPGAVEPFDSFHVRSRYVDDLKRVRSGATVDLVGGDVVAVETASGQIPVWGLGMAGATRSGLMVMICIGIATWYLVLARRKAEAAGGWWVADAPEVPKSSDLAVVLMMPATLGFLASIFWIPWWQVWLGVWFLLSAVGARASLRSSRRGLGRHRREVF